MGEKEIEVWITRDGITVIEGDEQSMIRSSRQIFLFGVHGQRR